MLVAARQLKEGLGQVTFKQVFFADNLRIAASSRGPAGPGALHPAAFPRRLHPHRGVPAPLGAPSAGRRRDPAPALIPARGRAAPPLSGGRAGQSPLPRPPAAAPLSLHRGNGPRHRPQPPGADSWLFTAVSWAAAWPEGPGACPTLWDASWSTAPSTRDPSTTQTGTC